MGERDRKQPSIGIGTDDVTISIESETEKGTYCNMATIHHSQWEFVVDFIFLLGNRGNAVSRIITNPQHAKALLGALAENVQNYENQYGEISPAPQSAQKPIITH